MSGEAHDDASSSSVTERHNSGVFISHVHEDRVLADAFALLLSDVTAGAVRTYSSSDTTPGGGIRYGAEWFQWIRTSVLAADHVVTLLTQRSLERPWILFEAGLGKAKPDGSVFGLALGVNVADASVGPFGVFQNSGSDEASLEKLCRQLIQQSGARPREAVLRAMIGEFIATLTEHLGEPLASSASKDLPASASAIFQAIEDLKFLVQRRETSERSQDTRVPQVEHMLELIERAGYDLPLTTRINILAAVGDDLGLSAIAVLVREVVVRRTPRSRRSDVLEYLMIESFEMVRPSSRAHEHFLHLARREFEWWRNRRHEIGDTAIRRGEEEASGIEDES